MFPEFIFWLCAGIVLYTYVGYPFCLGVVAFLRRRTWRRAPFDGTVSVVLVVYNEEANIERRLHELSDSLRACHASGDIIVVSDGSTDRTAAIAGSLAYLGQIKVVERKTNEGKAAALTAGCQASVADIVVFADARQRWADDALARLLENFAEPRVGAVSGDLALESKPGVMAGVGFYWRIEKWLRRKESQIHAQVGVTGAISAVRRELFRPIPTGTLLDDVYWPLKVVMQGYRVVHDERAVAFDQLPDKAGDEFRRKVRTLAGNFQLVVRLPAVLLPWRNPLWFQFLSHKLLRLAVPWALAGLLVANILLPGPFYLGTLVVQCLAYCLALIGLASVIGKHVPLAGTAASFLVLNAAAFLAFWVWASGRAERSWRKIRYDPASKGVA